QVLSAPNVLRVGTTENIFVECQDCTQDMTVSIKVLNFPTKATTLASTSVNLNQGNKYQALGKVKIPQSNFNKDPKMKQNVYLHAQFPGRLLEKVVLVSFQSGYIFIQTDKTLYTPNSKVNYRVFVVTPNIEPMVREDSTQTDTTISIEFQTPDGIILPHETVSPTSGIHSGSFKLTEMVSTGIWKVVVKFQSSPQESFTADFEVKEYVLPSFEVKLASVTSFFYVDTQKLTVQIKATYLFGKEVEGVAFVVFGIIDGDTKKSIPQSFQMVQIQGGKGVATLKREDVPHTFPEIEKLVGSFIFVSAIVQTENGGEMVEAELKNIQIVTSPYTINFWKTPKYFKQGITFDVTAEVLNPDKTPALFVDFHLDVTVVNKYSGLPSKARTDAPNILSERQASATMTVHPQIHKSNNFIHIVIYTAEVTMGETIKVNFFFGQSIWKDITYLILSRGQLVNFGRYQAKGQKLISHMLIISKEMLPSFRIVAYYHPSDDEVVSDSVWVDVDESCMGSLKLEPSRLTVSYEPRRMFGLRVTGDPGATVGLVAVDKGVYVLNNHRLTQKKIWDIVEKYDTGCTAGGGKDSINVFYDAGLLFESNLVPGTNYRKERKCETQSKRRKRASTIMDVTTSLTSQYKDELERLCCLDGMHVIPLSYSCERRSEYIQDGEACVKAFLHCCKEIEAHREEGKEQSLILARSEEDDSSYTDEITTRTQFPESWLWTDVNLPVNCPVDEPSCKTTSLEKTFPLQDSITTWLFTGISLSENHGICVSAPLEVIVRKDFFVDLQLPYSAVRGEQLEIKAILHNYSPDLITVRVDLIEVEHVCSSASKRRRYRQELNVAPDSTRSVPFIIIPMKEGELPIVVKAAVKDSSLNDGISKILRVVPAGVLVKASHIITLEPNKRGGTERKILNSGISLTEIVPNTPKSTQISVTGREELSTMLETAISGNMMGSLISQPFGCGEQNMITMTLPVIATMYLDKTNQWEDVGFQRRADGLRHIKTGYQNELAFRKSDGSFAVHPNVQSSTWLTAYVVKVFAMASNLVPIESSVICDAIRFLISQTQNSDGSFREIGRVYSSGMNGDVQGKDADASMTAFCLIALQEARSTCHSTVSNLPDSISRAVNFLETRLPHLTYSYAVAMTSYALANEKKLNRTKLFQYKSSDSTHWEVPKGIYTLEATAYALLALVKAELFTEAAPVVRWFTTQQKDGGGYGSTQATIIVYQAVAEYWANSKEPEYDISVDILLPGRSGPEKYQVNRENHYLTRTTKVNTINQDIVVTAKGSGEVTVKMVSLYYALPKEKAAARSLSMSVQLIEEKTDEVERVYKLRIDVLFKNKNSDATMSILDIGLLTGFTVNTRDLDLLSKGRARIISKYEMNTFLSERGSLIIYLNKVSHRQPEEISFRIHQRLKVGVMQPAAVSVYEYYDQTPCVKFYHPKRKAGELLQLCRNEECTCAEENCSMQKKEKISDDDRIAMTCVTSSNAKTDFVYKVQVDDFYEDLSTDVYTMSILESIKEGSYDVGPQGKQRVFLGFPNCRKSIGLVKGKTYLIMGLSTDIYKDEKNQMYQYVLGERTWIEYWPTVAECQTDEYRPTCLGMEDMVAQYRLFGCLNK
uniref:Complement component c3a, duplicate 5 n=1 Tax=Tetraodon nigroviridis TaxID=99883 RepID=H3DL28_TETNG